LEWGTSPTPYQKKYWCCRKYQNLLAIFSDMVVAKPINWSPGCYQLRKTRLGFDQPIHQTGSMIKVTFAH
jgi:hypothetical protein